MKRFHNILFVVDGTGELSEPVADKVIELARLNEAKVTVAIVMEDGLFDQLTSRLLSRDVDIRSQTVSIYRENISRQLQQQKWEGIEVRCEVLQGPPFVNIIQHVLRHDHDLVVKQNLYAKGVDSLAMRLLRKCPCPIWLFKADHFSGFKRVLAAVDVSSTSEETFLLNKKIIELAHSLAQRERGEAHYVYAWYLPSEIMLRGPRFKVSDEEILNLKKGIMHAGNDELSKLFKAVHVQPDADQVHILEGRTQGVIQKVIEEKQIDILVMGTVGRTGIPGLLIGNTAESLLYDIQCSLMAVKPDGFVSPVTL